VKQDKDIQQLSTSLYGEDDIRETSKMVVEDLK
jgi:hypothetical protein